MSQEREVLLEMEVERLMNELKIAKQQRDAKQAEIDRLMWEFCPNEMTPEQKAEWARHQKPVALDDALRGWGE